MRVFVFEIMVTARVGGGTGIGYWGTQVIVTTSVAGGQCVKFGRTHTLLLRKTESDRSTSDDDDDDEKNNCDNTAPPSSTPVASIKIK